MQKEYPRGYSALSKVLYIGFFVVPTYSTLLDNLIAVSVGQGSTAMTCKIMNIIRNRLQAVPDMIPQ